MKRIGSFSLALMLSVPVLVVMAASSLAGGWSREEVRQVTSLLDRVIQPRFLKVDGNFGLSRLARLEGHGKVHLYPGSEEDRRLLNEAREMRHAYDVRFMSIPHPSGTLPKGAPTIHRATVRAAVHLTGIESIFGQYGEQVGETLPPLPGDSEKAKQRAAERMERERARTDRLTQLGEAALPALRQGKQVESFEKGWHVSFRPVRASEQTCVSCHAGSKLGDTLGVMVYAVREAQERASREVPRVAKIVARTAVKAK